MSGACKVPVGAESVEDENAIATEEVSAEVGNEE